MTDAFVDFIMVSPMHRFAAFAILFSTFLIVTVGFISIVEAIHQAIKN